MKHSKTSVLTSGHVFKRFTLAYRDVLARPCPENWIYFFEVSVILTRFRLYTRLASYSSCVLEYKVYVLIVSNSISVS